MSQQLLIWSVSPSLIQQLETEGVAAFEIFWNADEDFNIEDCGIELSEALKLNAEGISNEGIVADERGTIEIQGRFANFIHWVLTGKEDASTLYGKTVVEFMVREEVIGENSWCLVNALVGSKKVRDAADYVASYLNPEETKNISLALAKIGSEDFELRCNTLINDVVDISEVEEFIKSELIPLYSNASEQKYGILIAWSI